MLARTRTLGGHSLFFVTGVCGLLLGCAGGAPVRSQSGKSAAEAAESDSVSQRFQRAIDAQQKRITELEARLSLLENEARTSRTFRSSRIRQTVTLGHAAGIEDTELESLPGPAEEVAAKPMAVDGSPIRLRLYGRPRVPAVESAGEPLPEVTERLAVAPLPGHGAKAAAPRSSLKTPFKARYLAALRMLRERRYADARAAFAALLTDFPEHNLADNVTYWLGEVAYAQRDYTAAVRAFETVLTRFPGSDKLPDSLFKAGLSHRQLGKVDTAEKYLTRVRSEFPESEVARLASAEGSR